ncbi:MAG: choice-of-anchor J domain-containing protein [Saprospiraceae bacterium]|nr:choice-of-anchor J domain-containing protein [Saprospiraceae bacterium]
MKSIWKTCLTLCLMSNFFVPANAQIVFSEDFDHVGGPTAGGAGTYSFPAGWTLFNVDNRTPAGAVSYVNEAWERREDFNFNVIDSCAFSTSWYTPAGVADDWMITPAIQIPSQGMLTWNAVAYDPSFLDGYEVRIGTSPTIMAMNAGTQLFSIAMENNSWTSRSASLHAFAGQTVYIAFHNNSNDKFLLLIDDIVVEQILENDVEIVSFERPTEYDQIPVPVDFPLNFQATVRNNGTMAASNVHFQVTVLKDGSPAYQANSDTVVSLASLATTSQLVAPSFIPDSPGSYSIEVLTKMVETDQKMSNDTAKAQTIVSDYVYARDNGNVSGSLGIGAGNGFLGMEYYFPHPVSVGSVLVYYTRGYSGRELGVAVWDMNGGIPDNLIAQTDQRFYSSDSAGSYVLEFPVPLQLDSGSYAFTTIEFDSTLAVGSTVEIFTPGRGWINWNGNPFGDWSNPEDYGGAFARSFVVRPNVCPTFDPDVVTIKKATCFSEGLITAILDQAAQPLSFDWTGGSSSDTVSLPEGVYQVTVTDANFCQHAAQVNVLEELTLNVNGMPIIEDTYAATEAVLSTGSIVSPDSISFESAGNITLQPDFSIQTGAQFIARIIPCFSESNQNFTSSNRNEGIQRDSVTSKNSLKSSNVRHSDSKIKYEQINKPISISNSNKSNPGSITRRS